MKTFKVKAGETLFNEGDIGNFACVIRSGQVDILKQSETTKTKLATLGPGEVFGEMALFDENDCRSASAIAVTDTIIDVINKDEMHVLIMQLPVMLQPFISALVSRLRTINLRVIEKDHAPPHARDAIRYLSFSAENVKSEHEEPVEFSRMELPLEIGHNLSQHLHKSASYYNVPIMQDNSHQVNERHCCIQILHDGTYVIDNNSDYGTIVNNISIGRKEATNKAKLDIGVNTIILGSKSSDMILTIEAR